MKKTDYFDTDEKAITHEDVADLTKKFQDTLDRGIDISLGIKARHAVIWDTNAKMPNGDPFPISEPQTRRQAESVLKALQGQYKKVGIVRSADPAP